MPPDASLPLQLKPEALIAPLRGDFADEEQAEERQPLKILMLEDNPADAELMTRELAKATMDFTAKRVDTQEAFVDALEAFAPDVVLLDCKLPGYDSAEALAHERHVHPEIPVVIVTGTIGDEAAIEWLKAGAKDYVLKSNLLRLPSAVERAISVEQGIRARKAAERAVRESEAKFRSVVEQNVAGIAIVRDDGTIAYVNPYFARLVGSTPPELIGRLLLDFVPEEEKAAVLKQLGAQLSSEVPFIQHQSAICAKDGRRIEVLINASRSTFEGRPASIAVVIDITERKAAEAALYESRRITDAILNSIPVRVFWKDKNLRYLGCNAAFAHDAGFADPEDIVGKDDFQMGWRDQAESYRVHDRKVIESGRPELLIEEPQTTPKGETLTLLTSKLPLRSASGEIEGVLGTYMDITDRKRAEEALRASEERFRLLVKQAPDAIMLYDLDQDRFVEVNDAAERLFGRPREEILKRGPHYFYPDDQPDGRLPNVSYNEHNRRAAAGERLSFERRVRRANGEDRLCDVTLVPMELAGRKVLRASMLDVTERKTAETALRRTNRALKALSAGNEVVVRAASEVELVGKMCRVVVELGGYRAAWIGVPQNNPDRIVKPIASAGESEEIFERMQISWADDARGQSPTGRAIRSGEPEISADVATDPNVAPWMGMAAQFGVASVAALPLKDDKGVFAVLSIYAAEPGAFDADEMKLLQELADDLVFGIRSQREHIEREALDQRWRASLEATIGAIASTVEMRDPYTSGHQQRVARLATAIARRLSMSEHDIHGIYLAGIIHDVGKINIPAEILNRPGKLSKLEFQLIQGHPQAGYDIVKGVDFPWPIAQMVLQHHERLDGSGYPQGIKGDTMLREAKILAIADVVEAMMSHRPYRPALGIDAALAEVEKGKGTLFDPEAVDACIALFREDGFHFD